MGDVKTLMIVVQATGTAQDGNWYEVPGPRQSLVVDVMEPIDYVRSDVTESRPVGVQAVSLVPSGTVEWDGDRCAEVWVPEGRLAAWRSEHLVD